MSLHIILQIQHTNGVDVKCGGQGWGGGGGVHVRGGG